MNSVFIKILSLMLVLLLAIPIPGCQQKAEDKDKDKDKSADVDFSKPATITLCFAGNDRAGAGAVLAEIENRLIGSLNIKLDIKRISDANTFSQKIKSMLSSGESIDAFKCMGPDALEFKRENYLYDITNLFPKYAPGYFMKLTEEDRSLVTDNGTVYAVPSVLPGTRRICAMVKDEVMKKYNIPDIKDFSDYEVYLKTAAENEKSLSKPNYYMSLMQIFAESYGYFIYKSNMVYKWDDPDARLIPWERTEAFRMALDTFRRWNTNQYIDSSVPYGSTKAGPKTSSFLEEWNYAQSAVHGRQAGYGLRVYPLYPDKVSAKTEVNNNVMVINKNSKNAERVLSFIEWVESNQSNYDLFMYGIEDSNYSLKGESLDLTQFTYPYAGWLGSEVFLNLDFMRPLITDPPDYKESYKNVVTLRTRYPVTYGLSLLDLRQGLDPVFALFQKRNESYTQFENDIRGGKYPNVDYFIEKLRSEGTDELLEVMQKIIDNWRKKSR